VIRHRTLCLLALTVGLAASTGCKVDKHVFESSAMSPKTVSLIDVQNDQTLWRYDIPVGHTLVMDLDRSGDVANMRVGAGYATEMEWWLYETSNGVTWTGGYKEGRAIKHDVLELDGMPVRLEMSVRDASREVEVATPPDEAAPFAPEGADEAAEDAAADAMDGADDAADEVSGDVEEAADEMVDELDDTDDDLIEEPPSK